MNYLSSAIFYVFSGVLLGILDRWNKKVLFFIIVVGIILIVVGGFVLGVDNITGDVKWYEYLFNIFWVVIGIYVGRIVYDGVFKR